MGGSAGHSFAAERESGKNVFEAVAQHAADQRKKGRTVILAAWSEGTRERMAHVLVEHGMDRLRNIESPADLAALKTGETALAILPIESGLPPIIFASSLSKMSWGDSWLENPHAAKRPPIYLAGFFIGGRGYCCSCRSRHCAVQWS